MRPCGFGYITRTTMRRMRTSLQRPLPARKGVDLLLMVLIWVWGVTRQRLPGEEADSRSAGIRGRMPGNTSMLPLVRRMFMKAKL